MLTSFFVLLPATAAHAQSPDPSVGPPPRTDTTGNPPRSTGLLRDGVFGCNAGRYSNIGTLSAIGGVYVPVNDAAVTLNTGYLVYKECVLDGVVSSIKNDQIAGLTRQAARAVETSREGSAQYVRNLITDLLPYEDTILVNEVTAAKTGKMCNAFKSRVPTAVARSYYIETRTSAAYLSCPFASDTDREAMVSGRVPVNWSSWNSLVEPTGYEIGEYYVVKSGIETRLATYDRNIREMLQYGNGFFPAFDKYDDPLLQKVITPSSIIARSLQRMLDAGTDILVNANEIDQINGSLQSGLQTSLVADTLRGLSGLSRPQNGQPAYLDRMAAESSAFVRANAVNAALGILAAARQVETLYKQAKEATANALTAAINKLRAAEAQCWNLIIPKVQEKAAAQGVSLRIATTTEFSSAIIDSQISPLALATIRDLRQSEDTLRLLNDLITNVTNSSSAANQRAALERLDSMVANGQLHSTQEAQNAQKQKDEIVAAIGTLVDDTLKEWGDSTEPDKGWCNVNNPAVIDRWFNAWRQ